MSVHYDKLLHTKSNYEQRSVKHVLKNFNVKLKNKLQLTVNVYVSLIFVSIFLEPKKFYSDKM